MANDKDFILKNAIEVGADTKVTLGTITSGTVDLSTGNYFADTLAANTTYTFSNPGDVQSFQMEITGGIGSGYALGDATYDGVSFSVSSQNSASTSIYFRPDGLRMFVLGATAPAEVNQYNLSTAWDLSTAAYSSRYNISQETDPQAIAFKEDGTKMYVVGTATDTIYQYTLGIPWSVAGSVSYDNVSYSVSTRETSPSGLFFKPDGTKMYLIGTSGDDVNEFNLSTAWDISTASYVQVFSVAGQETAPSDLFFTSDGTRLFVTGTTGDDVNEYTLSTEWDVSTASYVQSFSVTNQDVNPLGLFFKDDGTKMYVVCDGTVTVFQYTTATNATITWPASVQWPFGAAPIAPAAGETDVFTFVTDDAGTTYIGLHTADNLS